MNVDLKQVASVKYKCKTTGTFICATSPDDHVSIVTDIGVIIYQLRPFRDNTQASPSYTKLFLKPSQYIASNHLGLEIDPIIGSLNQEDLYEGVLRNDTSVCLDNCVKTKYVAVCAKWSPVGIIGMQCMLAVLNDSGSLDLYTKICRYGDVSFQHLVNVTEAGIDQYKKDWIDVYGKSATAVFMEFKRRLEANYVSAYVFSQLVVSNGNKFSILMVSYRSGLIAFWKINYRDVESYDEVDVSLLCDYQTNIKQITTMHWIESQNSGLLCVGNLVGEVAVVPITDITDSTVNVSKPIVFSESDELKVEDISSSIYKSKMYIFITKLSYLVIHLLSPDGQLLDTCCFNSGNIAIVALQILPNNKLLISNMTGVFKEVNVYSKDNEIQLEWRHLYVNINWSLRRSLGFFVSKHNLLYTFIVESCQMSDARKQRDFIHFTTFVNKSVDAVDILLKNESNCLRDYADCFDTVRVLSILDKQSFGYKIDKNLNYDKLNLSQLKTYMYLAQLNEYVATQKETLEDSNMKSFKELRSVFTIKLAVYYVQRILNKLESGGQISEFMRKSLKMLVGYIKHCIMTDVVNFNVWPNCVEELLDVVARTRKMELSVMTKCIICENGTNCLNKHLDVRCFVSMTQVVTSKYRCLGCQRVVSEECMEDFQVACCPLCDFPLDVIVGPKPSGKAFEELVSSMGHKEEYSKMFYDDELINKVV